MSSERESDRHPGNVFPAGLSIQPEPVVSVPPPGPGRSTDGPGRSARKSTRVPSGAVSTAEHAEACSRFAAALLGIHRAMPRSPDDPVIRCACGKAAVMCEINSAARDAGLLTPITGPAIARAGIGNWSTRPVG